MRLSLEQAMAEHGKRVFAAAYSLLKNRADAEDVVQDVFLRYYTDEKQFASVAHIRAWLLRTAINRAKDLLRAARRQRELPLEDVPAEQELPDDESGALFRAVTALPEPYRIVIHLHYYEDYSVREIAQLLRLPQATVKTRLFRGRQLLRQVFEEEPT